jgi:hypothetical protein
MFQLQELVTFRGGSGDGPEVVELPGTGRSAHGDGGGERGMVLLANPLTVRKVNL